MLRQTILLLIFIASMQTRLLDARRLRVGFQSSVVSHLDTNNFPFPPPTNPATTSDTGHPNNTIPPSNTPPSCTPPHTQLKYYHGLYGSNAANTFNGNILYYALKAVDTHNNISGIERTEEDNETVASFNESRYTPNGMELTNKVVCARILKEMDEEVKLSRSTVLCEWYYVCDYKEDRYPHYLFEARCKTARCNSNCNKDTNNHNICQAHGIHVTVLERKECNNWVWGQEILQLACTCTSQEIVKAESGMSK